MKRLTVLFEGDSLTANKYEKVDASIGTGYPFVSIMKAKSIFSDLDFSVFNEAVFGSVTSDILKRFENELKTYKPDIVSLFVGVNDCRREEMTIEEFKANYEKICELAKKYNAKLMLIEPFLSPVDQYKRYESRPRLVMFNEVIKSCALKYADVFIPLDGLFFNEFIGKDVTKYFVDGLHLAKPAIDFIGNLHADYLIHLIKKEKIYE